MNTKHLWLSVFILVISFFIFELTPIDITIQDFFFNFNTQLWLLDKQATIPKLIFYDGIKWLFILFILSLLICLLFFKQTSTVKKYHKGLMVVLLSCLVIPLFIGSLKAITNIPCPHNIRHYGGQYPYVTVLSQYPSSFHHTTNLKCYPAGHASGGFALMSLFFLFFSKKNKHIALVSALSLGWITGNYKMMIGDHFFSHTFITMVISWILILQIYYLVSYVSRHIPKIITSAKKRTFILKG